MPLTDWSGFIARGQNYVRKLDLYQAYMKISFHDEIVWTAIIASSNLFLKMRVNIKINYLHMMNISQLLAEYIYTVCSEEKPFINYHNCSINLFFSCVVLTLYLCEG